MTTSAQALEEIEKMEREAAAAHDPAHMGFSGMISTVVLDRALQIASEALEEVERLTGEVDEYQKRHFTTLARAAIDAARNRAQAAERENGRLRGALRFYRDEAWDLARDGDEETGQITAEWLEPSSALTNDQGSRALQALGDQT